MFQAQLGTAELGTLKKRLAIKASLFT